MLHPVHGGVRLMGCAGIAGSITTLYLYSTSTLVVAVIMGNLYGVLCPGMFPHTVTPHHLSKRRRPPAEFLSSPEYTAWNEEDGEEMVLLRSWSLTPRPSLLQQVLAPDTTDKPPSPRSPTCMSTHHISNGEEEIQVTVVQEDGRVMCIAHPLSEDYQQLTEEEAIYYVSCTAKR